MYNSCIPRVTNHRRGTVSGVAGAEGRQPLNDESAVNIS